ISAHGALGPALGEQDGKPTVRQIGAYEDVAKRRNLSRALVLKLVDRDLEVFEGKRRDGSISYVTQQELDEGKEGVVKNKPEPVAGRGPGRYGQARALQFGLARLAKETREEIAEEYRLPRSSLHDPLLGRERVPWRVVITGHVTGELRDRIEKQVRRAIGNREHHANLIIVQLECQGGDTVAAQDLARFLRELKDDDNRLPVMTVAYIPERAPDTAAIIAFGCTEIVMRKDATFGDCSSLVPAHGQPPQL